MRTSKWTMNELKKAEDKANLKCLHDPTMVDELSEIHIFQNWKISLVKHWAWDVDSRPDIAKIRDPVNMWPVYKTGAMLTAQCVLRWCLCGSVDTDRLVGWSFRRQMVLRRQYTSVVSNISTHTCCSKTSSRLLPVPACLVWDWWWCSISCTLHSYCSMVDTEVPVHHRLGNFNWHNSWKCSRDANVRCSKQLRFRRWMAVRLLCLWHGRLCLVCRLVLSLLRLTSSSPTNIIYRTWILAGDVGYHEPGRSPSNSLDKNILINSNLGSSCCGLCPVLGFLYSGVLHSVIYARHSGIRHYQKRCTFRSSLLGRSFNDSIWMAVRLASISWKTINERRPEIFLCNWFNLSRQHAHIDWIYGL